ncbi:ATP-binding protein [Maridesulfovibrio sp.]|uniref:ATP-binding protein n=1 Tax=Maridesulfovibrio sp. TaxID=2795000 RepID=UPI0039EE906C
MHWFRSIGIRCKLIIIFVVIKVLPLIALAWIAWNGLVLLGQSVEDKITRISDDTHETVNAIGNTAVESSIRALDLKSREAIERLTTDTARSLAAFLYDRDNDIRLAAGIEPTEENFHKFLDPLIRQVTLPFPWVLNESGDAWGPSELCSGNRAVVVARNSNNTKDFHSRPAEHCGIRINIPLFLEMTFVDLEGHELVKVGTSDILSKEKKDISDKANTYCKAEGYFTELKKLKPGEIYVSEVIGPYVGSPIIGPYTKASAEKKGIPFEPEKAAYAGKENPVGKRFKGLVRWATPVVRGGKVVGYVTLALDHTHIMEFSDHIVPTAERYSAISDASTGNYAFIWDYKDRNISHPRDYFITGYDPQTGLPAVPWLSEEMYEDFLKSGKNIAQWEKTVPVLRNQSLEKKPARELTDAGLLGLDCRYLNFAPQCDGWNNLTKNGGSGSFVILWSGLWKLTTAAAIPYHTGRYSGPRGFGFVTIGANVREFHKAATDTGKKISTMATDFQMALEKQNEETQELLHRTQANTSREITLSTLLMVGAVIFIAIWMASTLTKKITTMIASIRKFQAGDMDQRLKVESGDEMGQLAHAFNEMSDGIQNLVVDLRQAEEQYRSFFENATEGTFRSTPEGQLVTVNPAFARLTGYDSVEDVLENIQDIATQLFVDPQRREEMLRLLEEHGHIQGFEFEARLPSGEIRQFANYCRLINDKGQVFIEGMVSDVSQHKLMKQVEIEKETAIQANKAKSVFLANMSHEIRTPLNAILGVTDLLLETELTEEQKQYINLFKTSGEGLLRLINEILDFSKIEAGQMMVDNYVFNLQALLKEIKSFASVPAGAAGLEFRMEVDENVPVWVNGDSYRVRQILLNLLGNAIKFTHAGSVLLEVEANPMDGGITEVFFRVEDTGIGIDKDKIEKIFESFAQADSSTTRSYGGTGLGLPISKRLAELMGGAIEISSGTGGGTSVLFKLPFTIHCEPEQTGTELDLSPQKSASNRAKKVLVVEDSQSNRTLIEFYLKGSGHKLVMAENGLEGLETYKESPDFDIIFMDVQMPMMDGLEATRKIRLFEEEKGLSPVKIVALTANAFEDDRNACLAAGCNSFLAKPVKKEQLINHIG